MAREKQMNESRKLIEDALIRILLYKPLDKISMTEVAKEADVVRMTLYRHFKTKEEIILSIVEGKVDKLISKMGQNSKPTMYDLLLFRFRILKNSPFTEMLYQHNYLDKLLTIIRNRSIAKMYFLSISDYKPMAIEFIGGGIDAITVKWISNGMNEPPEYMAKTIEELIIKIRASLK